MILRGCGRLGWGEVMSYRKIVEAKIADVQKSYNAHPMLFVGAGLSIRYFDAPSWSGLLADLISHLPNASERPLDYYSQKIANNEDIASALVPQFFDFAWGAGKNSFPKEIFSKGFHESVFLKWKTCNLVDQKFSENWDSGQAMSEEIDALKAIQPFSIATTNYDRMLEDIFPEHEPVVGQSIISRQNSYVGEIFKIHGCVSQPDEIVITRDDYNEFIKKKKYLSAKLLTMFCENPVIFIGYGLGDRNVAYILSEICEALNLDGNYMKNVFFVKRTDVDYIDEERETRHLVDLGGGKSVSLNLIEACDFKWVYEAFKPKRELASVHPRLMRALIHRAYEVSRSSIPKANLEMNLEMIEGKLASNEEFSNVLGFAYLPDAVAYPEKFKYSPDEVGKLIDNSGWHIVNKLIKKIFTEKGVDIKATSNKYHSLFKTSAVGTCHRYTEDLVDLLRLVMANADYDVDIEVA
jgi:hypothetical protein